MEQQTKNCQNCKNQFVIESDDFAFYEKMSVPPPTWCPECRMQRRFMFRNERYLYRRKCDATQKDIFSMFSPEAPVRVYDRDYWWSDAWDASEYGRDYDFSRPFFEQFQELMRVVPWFSRSANEPLTNCDYCMNIGWAKDCYLVFNASNDENCYYSIGIEESKDSFDSLYLRACELCSNSAFLTRCYSSHFSVDCEDSHNLYFCKSCSNCTDCFGCVNLRNKQYHIFNQPYSKEEYEKKLKGMGLSSYRGVEELRSKFRKLLLDYPHRASKNLINNNVTGEYIHHSKNVVNGYLVDGVEDSKYVQFLRTVPSARDCYDYSLFGANSEMVYESVVVGMDAARVKFSAYLYPSPQDIEYSIACTSSRNLFGCMGLKKKEYCILNKQYTQEEYEKLLPKIIQHMSDMPYTDKHGRVYKYGEFFPPEISPFAYNETINTDMFPLSKDKIEADGLRWANPAERNYQATITAKDIPDDIRDASDDIAKETIGCEHNGACEHNCSTVFRIIPNEFAFYRRMNLPLPRLCFSCRHADRLRYQSMPRLWKRSCAKCNAAIQTSYAPDRPEIVYCESCYNAEVA